jgi:outer membrane protein OmpA-like peptidoglycan-associated protein
MLILPFSPNMPFANRILPRIAEPHKADAVIDGYPEYGTHVHELKPQQRHALLTVAESIVRSRSTRFPIEAVVVVGHADKALRKPVQERTAFELEVSQRRATAARNALLGEVRRLASDAHFSKVLLCPTVGMGNRKPVVRDAATEAQMRRNRRVEIFLFQRPLSEARCRVSSHDG